MNLWSMWLDAIRYILGMLSSEAGLGLGFAIIIGTLLLRSALLPISFPIAYRGYIRRKKMLGLQPQLNSLRKRFRDKPELYMQKMAELYRRHDLQMLDNRSLLGAALQMPLLMGMYQVLRKVGDSVRFLWVPNLMRPDAMLALLVALSTVVLMAFAPDMTEQVRMFMIFVFGTISFLFALKFSSALALYMVTSNTFSTLQTYALQVLIQRRISSGSVKI